MSDTKHTPGPWVFEDDMIIAPNAPLNCFGSPVVVVVDLRGSMGGSDTDADARLIASAPALLAERDRLKETNAELLEALEAANRLLWSEGYTTSHEVVANIELVLNKAKGERNE